MIYLDNSATTLIKPKTVYDRMLFALKNYANPSRGAYPAATSAMREIHTCREKLSTLFGLSDPSQVSFTANVTEALNICAEMLVKERTPVITTVMEHNSVLRPFYKKKARLNVVGLDDMGALDYAAVERGLKDGARLVFATHASNLTGDMVDINKVGALCREYGALFVLDAAQTAGVFEIDMEEQNIDVVCFTGHKSLFGPPGVGGICAGKRVDITPIKVGGSGINSFSEQHPEKMPEALEAGTQNTPAICGLSAGLDFINDTGIDNIRKHELELAGKLRQGLSRFPEIIIYGSFKAERAPVVAFNISGADSGAVAEALWDKAEIAVRSGAHCAPLFHKYLGTQKQGAVRMSVSYFNTMEEIEKAVWAVGEICG